MWNLPRHGRQSPMRAVDGLARACAESRALRCQHVVAERTTSETQAGAEV